MATRRCRGPKGRFKKCGTGGAKRRATKGKKHCAKGVSKTTGKCLKRKRSRR